MSCQVHFPQRKREQFCRSSFNRTAICLGTQCQASPSPKYETTIQLARKSCVWASFANVAGRAKSKRFFHISWIFMCNCRWRGRRIGVGRVLVSFKRKGKDTAKHLQNEQSMHLGLRTCFPAKKKIQESYSFRSSYWTQGFNGKDIDSEYWT